MSESKHFVQAKGKYVDDIKLPNMLHMMVARSPHAYAKIVSIKGGLNGNELKATVSSTGEGEAETSILLFCTLLLPRTWFSTRVNL